MLRLVTDEHIHGGVVTGIRMHHPEVDIVRVQDVGLAGSGDAAILDWAAREDRIVVSQDRRTLIRDANDRIVAGLPVPGVLILKPGFTIGEIIEEIALLAVCSLPEEWKGRIEFIPL
jgi:predicted nuclease of predicted toxin-antitoxin system